MVVLRMCKVKRQSEIVELGFSKNLPDLTWNDPILNCVNYETSNFLIETEGRQLSTYESYQDVQMLSYDIPDGVKQASWKFYLHRQSDCSNHNVSIYVRYGGYPVINPDNATFPSNFFIDQLITHHLEVKLGTTSLAALNISSPKPGKYFAASFIKRNSNRIQQRCKVVLSTKLTFDKQDDVEMLIVNTQLSRRVKSYNYYKFMLSDLVDSLTIVISVANITSDSSISVSIAYSSIELPDLMQSKNVAHCTIDSSNNSCTLFVLAPGLRNWNYILINSSSEALFTITLQANSKGSLDSRVTFENDVTVVRWLDNVLVTMASSLIGLGEPGKVFRYSYTERRHIEQKNSSQENDSTLFDGGHKLNKSVMENQSKEDEKETEFCLRQINPEKISAAETFKYSFLMLRIKNSSFHPVTFNISHTTPVLISFYLDSVLDIGGTLNVDVILFSQQENDTYKTSDNVTLLACLDNGSIPKIDAFGNCTSKLLLTVNANKTGMLSSASLSLPFPEAGQWYLVFKTLCSGRIGNMKSSCNDKNQSVYFHINSEMCVKGGCGTYGTCQPFISGGLIFSSCVCTAGWKGWSCTDGSDALSDNQLLTATLLLTLSNLLFIPAIILAIYRRYFTEALVYFFTMFFSTFYHACDVDVYTFCLMRGSVMQFCDFYASIMSFWMTVIALADLPEYLRSVSHMAGALGIALGVEYDRTGLWVFVIPFATAIIIMTTSWFRRCKQQKICYPEKKRWFFGILPGIILAGTGLILFAFFETKANYAYIHSTWHAATALSILVLLPYKKNQGRNKDEISLRNVSDDETDQSSS
ncbi:Post-GPI attachment to proteins factor 6 [Nymphon striatum]|nr:Post-GPI attachment to proteins factor 6 [Nymphon striatum]